MRSVRATTLCGIFLFGSLCGSLIALLIGWGQGDRWVPGMQSSWTRASVVPTTVAEMEQELRRGRLPMEVNEAVEFWILHFTTDRKSVFEYALSRGAYTRT